MESSSVVGAMLRPKDVLRMEMMNRKVLIACPPVLFDRTGAGASSRPVPDLEPDD